MAEVHGPDDGHDDVWHKEHELALAQLGKEHDALNERIHAEDATDEERERFKELSNEIVAHRQELRLHREAVKPEVPEGDGVATPEPVAGSTEVH
jgi:hypothetical protein